MVDPLLGRGVLCFERGVRGDVFRHFFSPDDFSGSRSSLKENKKRGGKARDHTRKHEES
jgi:hypothetical protein